MDTATYRLINDRDRRLWTGSPELLAHQLTDDRLERIVADELDARNAAGQHHNVERLQRAAELELAWRQEAGVTFGWTRR